MPPPPSTVTGWAGRGDGPVDTPASSSCISSAMAPRNAGQLRHDPRQQPQRNAEAPLVPQPQPGQPFTAGNKTLDFSLQLGVGIQNFREFQDFVANNGGFPANPPAVSAQCRGPSSSRSAATPTPTTTVRLTGHSATGTNMRSSGCPSNTSSFLEQLRDVGRLKDGSWPAPPGSPTVHK